MGSQNSPLKFAAQRLSRRGVYDRWGWWLIVLKGSSRPKQNNFPGVNGCGLHLFKTKPYHWATEFPSKIEKKWLTNDWLEYSMMKSVGFGWFWWVPSLLPSHALMQVFMVMRFGKLLSQLLASDSHLLGSSSGMFKWKLVHKCLSRSVFKQDWIWPPPCNSGSEG